MRYAKSHIACYVQMRDQCVVLKHHAQMTLLSGHMCISTTDDLRAQHDAAAAGAFQPGYGSEQRGLTAT